MRRAGSIVGGILILVAFVLGYWPEHQSAQDARQQLRIVSDRLNETQSRIALCRLQDHLLATIRQAQAKNYGDASSLSTAFFNDVSRRAAADSDPGVKSALQSILQQRDAVTAALAKGDPSALGLLQPLEDTMFSLVDKAVGSAKPSATTASPTPLG